MSHDVSQEKDVRERYKDKYRERERKIAIAISSGTITRKLLGRERTME
jgi:hypothetical protein